MGWIRTPLGRSAVSRADLDVDSRAAFFEGSGHWAMGHPIVGRYVLPCLGERDPVKPGCLLVDTSRMVSLPNRILSAMGAQTSAEGLALSTPRTS